MRASRCVPGVSGDGDRRRQFTIFLSSLGPDGHVLGMHAVVFGFPPRHIAGGSNDRMTRYGRFWLFVSTSNRRVTISSRTATGVFLKR